MTNKKPAIPSLANKKTASESQQAEATSEAPTFEQQPIVVKSLKVPTQDLGENAFFNVHGLSVQALTHEQKIGLAILRRGLTASNVRLNNGKEVKDNANSIKWLLERVANALEVNRG